MKTLESLGKTKMEQLISRLIYDAEPSKVIHEDWEERLENSFKEFTTRLEALYEGIDQDDNCLFGAIADFAQIHDDIYFETGFLTGVKLAKRLEYICGGNGHNDLEKM